ncbi:MAG: amino acid permease [Alphaproteobacteria bacterium]|nr:amino acid permease [Alphaproteobacteria bacterium]MDE2111209.1 amino acid permease [Alphaproteobacteria bacterium]MDE2496027.1 amino acid permease [Alphaproteobacteria bacterium]
MAEDTDLTQPDPVLASEIHLRRTLGPFSLIMIGIGSIIGAGIFVIAGNAAAEHAGPAVLLSFVIAGVGCFFAGLCYAEFASMIPESGSSYTYAYATMGRSMAWFIGWNMVLEYLVSAAGVAAGWSGYFVSLLHEFGFNFPATFANAPLEGTGFQHLHLTGDIMNLPAVVLIAGLSAFLIVGVQESARFNGLMVLIKVGIVLLVILFGLPYVHTANLHPFIPPNEGQWGKFGVSGILAASGMIFFAYIGFEAVSVAAQEAKNPKRDLPIGILGSLFICTALYVLMAVVLTGITDWRTLDVPDPVSFAVGKIAALKWLVPWIDVGALVGLASVTFVSLYGQSRVFYSMARDGFLPPAFSAIHKRFRTPHIGTYITSGVAIFLAAAFPFDVLAELVSVGTLLAFIAVCAGVMILRVTAPRAARQFRIAYVWFVAPAGVIVCTLMMISLFLSSPDTLSRLIVWTGIGIVIFIAYGYWHAAPSKWTVTNED